jgi:hypothetical protein
MEAEKCPIWLQPNFLVPDDNGNGFYFLFEDANDDLRVQSPVLHEGMCPGSQTQCVEPSTCQEPSALQMAVGVVSAGTECRNRACG